MYAIIKSGSRQFRVKKGDVIDVDLLDVEGREQVEFENVLFVQDGKSVKVGTPFLENAVVKADLVSPLVKGPKVISYKFKRRKNYHRKIGHRQKYTRVMITEIAGV